MQYREGEHSVVRLQSPRFFCIAGQWFFSTREQVQVGPFDNLDNAEIKLNQYLRHIHEGGIYAADFAYA